MALVIDASVALKWVLQEEGRATALGLLREGGLIAPDFLWLECANVLTTKARTGKITSEAAAFSLRQLRATPVRLVPTLVHLDAAQALALALGRTVYDSLYLALALAEDATLVTADTRFASAAERANPGVVRRL